MPSRPGDGHRRAAGQDVPGLRADADHHAGRARAERVEVVLVVVAGNDVLPDQRVVPGAVVLHRQAEYGRVGRGLLGVGDWTATEAAVYELALSQAKRRNHRKAPKLLLAIGPPPHTPSSLSLERAWIQRLDGQMGLGKSAT